MLRKKNICLLLCFIMSLVLIGSNSFAIQTADLRKVLEASESYNNFLDELAKSGGTIESEREVIIGKETIWGYILVDKKLKLAEFRVNQEDFSIKSKKLYVYPEDEKGTLYVYPEDEKGIEWLIVKENDNIVVQLKINSDGSIIDDYGNYYKDANNYIEENPQILDLMQVNFLGLTCENIVKGLCYLGGYTGCFFACSAATAGLGAYLCGIACDLIFTAVMPCQDVVNLICGTFITLSSIEAIPENNSVTIKWATESEIDNVGFNLYRSESENGQYTKINTALILAKGSSTQGASYEFADNNVKNRKTYYYKLEDIDPNGNSTMHGPVNATPRWLLGIFRK